MPSTFIIESTSLRSAAPDVYAQLNTLRNTIRAEILPDDPPFPIQDDIGRWQNMPVLERDSAWLGRDRSDGPIVALAQAFIFETGDNPHVVWFNIEVLPECRRRGWATALLARIAEHTRLNNRRLLLVECSDRIAASAAFLTRIGASRGLEEPVNEVSVANLDRALIDRWLQKGATLSSEFAVGLWADRYPDGRLQDMADLLQVTANDRPRDSLQTEDINYSPELVRQFDEEQRAGGDQRWSLYVTSRREDRLVAVTEVYWNPSRPTILHQGFTGVRSEFRGRGLGRWLKAAMLERIIRDRPQVKFIRTGNASSNVPMLKINRQLGFKPLVIWSTWQVELENVERYLAA